MRTIYLEPDQVPAHLRTVGGYAGLTSRAEVAESVTLNGNYWDGGSRSYWFLVRLADGAQSGAPTDHPGFDRLGVTGTTWAIPEGFCAVEHVIFSGKDMGLVFHMRPDSVAVLLPAPAPELTREERGALYVIAGIRGGAARREEWHRVSRCDIGEPYGEPYHLELPGEYGPDNPLVLSLRAKGLVTVNKAGAVPVTTAGMNGPGTAVSFVRQSLHREQLSRTF